MRDRQSKGVHHAITSILVRPRQHSDSISPLPRMHRADDPDLDLTKPSAIGFEMRVFQGVNCDHVDRLIAETKSMSWASFLGLQAPV